MCELSHKFRRYFNNSNDQAGGGVVRQTAAFRGRSVVAIYFLLFSLWYSGRLM